MYFSSSQTSRLLPMPPGPVIETRRARRSRPTVWSCSFSCRSSSSRPTNGASRVSVRPWPPRCATTRSACHAGTGLVLPLSEWSPIGSKTIADSAARLRGLADQHGARVRHALQAGRGVDEVAGDHALVGRAERDRRLAGQQARARLEVRVQRADRVDQLEGGANGPLGVVLVGGRRAPHGHDRVADELLDRPAVQLDDLGGGLEVFAQQLADRLGIAVLGEAREADEIGEEDGDEAPLGRGRRGWDRFRRRRIGCRASGRRSRRSARRSGSARRSAGRSRRAGCRSCRRTCCRRGSRRRSSRRSCRSSVGSHRGA